MLIAKVARMYGKAFAPEYQGALWELSVNTAYEDVLAAARERESRAEADGTPLELAQARLGVAEACRRLGRLDEADAAWRASYHAAKSVSAQGAMAWALWSGGTLARQCGKLNVAVRWLKAGRDLAEQAGDIVAYGYTFAGIAETLRIRGDHEEARVLHEHVLAEARKRGESRHIVWALEGLAQIDRFAGDLDSAWNRFEEAARTAEESGDERGHAWALRGLADVSSLRGDHDQALLLLSQAEQTCRQMDLSSALAYNRKMRGNVLFRASWYGEASRTYRDAREKFRAIGEPRGEALAQLGLLKSLDKLGRPRPETERDLAALRDSLQSHELGHTRQMVENTIEELTSRP
ncbi:hypothetical protein N599_16970 [Saccharopolyspora erythraea D]|nr:hypothetical protein N599_16970 [Saccharopolyspora erythraea D]